MSTNRRNFRFTFGAAVVLLVAISVFVTSILGNLGGARLDLTSDKLFTMSPAAAKILSGLEVPVQVKYYVTQGDKMPNELKKLEQDVADKLRDYERVSGGKLQFQVFNPQDNEELQNELTAKGISPFQVQRIERDEVSTVVIWSALTIAYKDYPEEVVPQVLPQSLPNLEYDLVSRVYRLVSERQPRVALYAPLKGVDPQLAMMYLQQGMQPPQPQEVFAQIAGLLRQEHYDVVKVDLTPESRIPEDADVLVVMNPQDLNERQAFEINRALCNGLPTIMAVQAHEYEYSPAPRGGWTFSAHAAESGLEDMLRHFGLLVTPNHFFDTSLQVLEVPRPAQLGGMRVRMNDAVSAPIQILVTETQMNAESALTNRIGSVLYLWGTPVELNVTELSRHQLTSTTLMSSSDRCWIEPYNDGVMPGSYMMEDGKEFAGPQPLAVMLEGRFPDSFQGRTLPDWPDDPAAADEEGAKDDVGPEPVADTASPLQPADSKLMVVGCAKMFDDSLIGAGQNALLLLNAVDYMAHGEDLISIRAKSMTQRVIKPATDTEKLMYRIFVIGLVPVVLALFGIFRATARKREAAAYREKHIAHKPTGL